MENQELAHFEVRKTDGDVQLVLNELSRVGFEGEFARKLDDALLEDPRPERSMDVLEAMIASGSQDAFLHATSLLPYFYDIQPDRAVRAWISALKQSDLVSVELLDELLRQVSVEAIYELNDGMLLLESLARARTMRAISC